MGDYSQDIDSESLIGGFEPLIKEQEPTMVVIPETVCLDQSNSKKVQQAAVKHCGDRMRNRVAILDIREGYRDRQDPAGDCIEEFRMDIDVSNLDFAIAYYPWVNTAVVEDTDLNCDNVKNKDKLQAILKSEVEKCAAETNLAAGKLEQQQAMISSMIDPEPTDDSAKRIMLNKGLNAISPLYINIMTAIKFKLNQLPPAAAMAGMYTRVDSSRGVWKAPANVSMIAVVSPAVNISHFDQEDLNVNTQGKSINAIRTFIGQGTLVWGARTLDGNSLDWRYINVRRTMIMLEHPIRLATRAYVFESNDANTWVTIKSMIGNFLTGIWKRGGLAGAAPDDAFSIHVGLGQTMTGEDILKGNLIVSVYVAVNRAAEFIEITFKQQMQES